MSILVFAHQRVQDLGSKIASVICGVSSDIDVDLKTTADVFRALSQPLAQSRYTMVVLMIDTDNLLDHFIKNRHFLDGHRILLVVPDYDLKIISKAHQLLPRFITHLDSDFSEIGEIIKKWRQSSSDLKTDMPRRGSENAQQIEPTEECR
jgi:hypothetical protein